MSEHDDEATEPIEEDEPTAEDRDEQGSSREAEILAARRESLARLADAGMDPFALTLETALGVAEPDPIAGIHREFGDLAPGTTGDAMPDGRRTHRAAARHGQAEVPGGPRPYRRHPALLQRQGHGPGGVRPARRGRPRRHRRRHRPRRDDEEGRAVDLRGAMGDAHEEPASAPREMARPEGPRPAAASPVPAPGHRRRCRAATSWRVPPSCRRCAACWTSAGSSSSKARCCSSWRAARTPGRSPRSITCSTRR